MNARPSPRAGGVVAALLACLVACQGGEPPPPVPAPPPALIPVAPPRVAPLAERLAREAEARPAHTPRIEDLVAALRARGVTIARTRQVLGATMGARFCAIAETAAGHALAACEYDSAEAALEGQARAARRFDALVPGRRSWLRDKTLLTLAPRGGAFDDETRTIQTAFAALDVR